MTIVLLFVSSPTPSSMSLNTSHCAWSSATAGWNSQKAPLATQERSIILIQRLQKPSGLKSVWKKSSDFQLGAVLSSMGHYSVSGNIMGHHNLGKGVLLASSGWKPGMLLHVLQCTGQSLLDKELSSLQCQLRLKNYVLKQIILLLTCKE